MVYCIDGKPPYYKTLKEVRKVIIDSGKTDGLQYDDKRTLIAKVCDGNGEVIGWVTRMNVPVVKSAGYYWDSSKVGRIVEIEPNGDLVKEDAGLFVSIEPEKSRYKLVYGGGGIMMFCDLEQLCKGFLKMAEAMGYPDKQGCNIADMDGNILGIIIRDGPTDALMEIDGKFYEVDRWGRRGARRKDIMWNRKSDAIIQLSPRQMRAREEMLKQVRTIKKGLYDLQERDPSQISMLREVMPDTMDSTLGKSKE